VKTIDVECVVMQYCRPRQNTVVPNVSWGIYHSGKLLHECDVLCLSAHGYATEYEIKVSLRDLKKDGDKSHGHDHPLIKNLYFVVPRELQDKALELIPERAGLIIVEVIRGRHRVFKIKEAVPRKDAVKWSESMRFKLMRLAALRITTLKSRISKLEKRLAETKRGCYGRRQNSKRTGT